MCGIEVSSSAKFLEMDKAGCIKGYFLKAVRRWEQMNLNTNELPHPLLSECVLMLLGTCH